MIIYAYSGLAYVSFVQLLLWCRNSDIIILKIQ